MRQRQAVDAALAVGAVASAYAVVPASGSDRVAPQAWIALGLTTGLLLRWQARDARLLLLVAVCGAGGAAYVVQGEPVLATGYVVALFSGARVAWRGLRPHGRALVLRGDADLARWVRAAAATGVVTAVAMGAVSWVERPFSLAVVLSAGLGGAAAVAVLVPALLEQPRARVLASGPERVAAAAFVLGVAAVLLSGVVSAPVLFALLPAFVWLAFRCSLGDVSRVLVVLAGLVVAATVGGLGPVADLAGGWSLGPDGVDAVMQLFLLDCALLAVAVTVTVAGQRLAADQAAAGQRQWQRLVSAVRGTAIVATDAAGVVTVFNPAAEALWRRPASKVVGHSADELVPEAELRRLARGAGCAPEVVALCRASIAAGQQELSSLARQPDGALRVIQVGVSELRDEDEAAGGHLLTVVDVTEREQVRQALLDGLAHEQAAARGRREVDQVRSDFVASVSHELRTPITSILGYSEVLADGLVGDLQPDQRDMVEKVERNTLRLLDLVEDLLMLSKIQTARLRIDPHRADLRGLVKTAVAQARPLLDGRELRLEVELPESPVVHEVDPTHLGRAVGELIENAVKFTDDGGAVSVALRRVDDGTEVSVVDTGVGLGDAEPADLVAPFGRGPDTVAKAVPGAGVGLSIARAVVVLHGGTLRLQPARPRGTEVTIWLPGRAPNVVDLDDWRAPPA